MMDDPNERALSEALFEFGVDTELTAPLIKFLAAKGYKIVGREPSEAMCVAWGSVLDVAGDSEAYQADRWVNAKNDWRAMFDAAQPKDPDHG